MINSIKREEVRFNKFTAGRRIPIKLSQKDLIKTGYLETAKTFPLVVEPNAADINLVAWAKSHREFVETNLLKYGAILFRGFDVNAVSQFEEFTRAVSDELLDYQERAAPRTEVSKNVYTSTEFPSDQWIPSHHEMSYSHNWPTKIWFYCAQPAEQGGGTPITEDRKVFERIPAAIKDVFMRKQVMYVRNYGEGVDMPWQEVFQTHDKTVVEDYCRRSHMQCDWREGSRLRTRQVRQAVVTHPKTGDTLWFNHAHMFHVSNLEPAVREALLSEFKENELPRNAFFGDGTPIEDSILDEIRAIYREAAVSFTWQKGDVLMLDNFLCSHGREPFTGPRKILVAMADLYTNQDYC